MAEINVTFMNNSGASAHFSIVDTGRDPNVLPTFFDGFLEYAEVTAALPVYAADGVYGKIASVRSANGRQYVDVQDGTQVSMD